MPLYLQYVTYTVEKKSANFQTSACVFTPDSRELERPEIRLDLESDPITATAPLTKNSTSLAWKS